MIGWNRYRKNLYLTELSEIDRSCSWLAIDFDRDSKHSTVLNVNREIDKLGRLFTTAKCSVSVITLPGPEKGIDDFVVARGEDALIALKNAARGFQLAG